MQLGAFYPFMRNHMIGDTLDHFAYSLGERVLQASIASIKLRYSIIKYYYSIFVSNQGTGSVFRPLFFDFINDPTLLSLETQFLLGSALMVSAITQEGQTDVYAYFPSGSSWYHFSTGELLQEINDAPQNLSFPTPLNETLPIFIRGGFIVPTQDSQNAMSLKDLDNVFNLVVALNRTSETTSESYGQIMAISNFSNDSSIDQCTLENNCMVNIAVYTHSYDNGTVGVTVSYDGQYPYTIVEEVYIGKIALYGIRGQESNAVVCGGEQEPQLLRTSETSKYLITRGVCEKVDL